MNHQTICLNMIVKNESAVITRCLSSVKDLIDYWVIVDTGSTDGTQEIIREFLKKIPGELHERAWVNFAHNRNEALSLAKNKGDVLLLIDADEQLLFSESFCMPDLNDDCYLSTVQQGGLRFQRILMVNNALNWAWEGSVHEQIVCHTINSYQFMTGVINNAEPDDGARTKGGDKCIQDARILEEDLKKDPTNSRAAFFLAQSYLNAKEFSSMGGDPQEMFWSLLLIGWLQENLQFSPDVFISSYCKAYAYNTARAEPLFRLAHYFLRTENYILGYSLSKLALSLPLPQYTCFIEYWIYDYGLLSVFAECACQIKKHEESKEAVQKLLANQNLPGDIRDHIENNFSHVDQVSLL
jgi:glycosyltransferase involved in cell wall biosynthesis